LICLSEFEDALRESGLHEAMFVEVSRWRDPDCVQLEPDTRTRGMMVSRPLREKRQVRVRTFMIAEEHMPGGAPGAPGWS
jgi:hypothetical protein